MSSVIPEATLRRKRKSIEGFWLKAVRKDNNDEDTEDTDSEGNPTSAVVTSVGANAMHTPPHSSPGTRLERTAAEELRVIDDDGQTKTRYIKRVQGPTLGSVMNKIRLNEAKITELDFSNLSNKNKRLEPFGGVLVARALTPNHTVKKLVIRDHAIGDRGAIAIANMLRFNTTLEYIDLYSNDITDKGAEALAKVLYGHESVQHLTMWSNQITDTGARALAEALKCNRRLKYLGLVHNRITRPGAEALLEALEVNLHLETLNLATNRVPASIASQIRISLARNRVEAPKLMSMMKKEEELQKLMMLAQLMDDDYDTCSESSGFLSCSEDEDEEDENENEIKETAWV